jgi:hypothetical protein
MPLRALISRLSAALKALLRCLTLTATFALLKTLKFSAEYQSQLLEAPLRKWSAYFLSAIVYRSY